MKNSVVFSLISVAALCAACDVSKETEATKVVKDDEVSVEALAEKMVSAVEITELLPEELPADVAALIDTKSPEFQIEEIQKKVRDGRTYFDVEGETAAGEEIEFDILMNADGPKIVEIQRDISWEEVPDIAKNAVELIGQVNPVRVIESKQPDSSIIYELFAEGQPDDPSMEVKVADGVANVLTERWPH